MPLADRKAASAAGAWAARRRAGQVSARREVVLEKSLVSKQPPPARRAPPTAISAPAMESRRQAAERLRSGFAARQSVPSASRNPLRSRDVTALPATPDARAVEQGKEAAWRSRSMRQ